MLASIVQLRCCDTRLLTLTGLPLLVVFAVLAVLICSNQSNAAKPNIVYIMADDMGYGDPQCFNADSKCVTPHIDRLASQGMMFTDAHSAGSVCVPSRYGLLTGRYPFREPLDWRKEGVIAEDRATVASFLRDNGYSTHMVGKWHLGFDGGPDYDYSKPLPGGPVDRGFDTYFGEYASLDIPPYYYIRGDRAVQAPTETVEASSTEGWSPIQGKFWREGPISPDFKHIEVLDRWKTESEKVLSERRGQEQPFFLYVALTAPHTPWFSEEKYKGIGGAGMYSEFVAHVDDVVGQIVDAIDKHGFADNTLVIFTSDNGPTWYDADEEKYGHFAAGPLRGMKADSWEGGHRIPFIARWPGVVEAGSTSDQLLGFTDIFATVADILNKPVPDGAAEDSVSFLHAMKQQKSKQARTSIVLHHAGTVMRDGDWKLINHLASGGFTRPNKKKPEPGGPKGQLYNLKDDLGEQNNLWLKHPEIVQRLERQLDEIKGR